METLYEVIVVEGKQDKAQIKRYFDAIVIEVGGLSLRPDALEKLDILANVLPLIGFFDPDSAGRKIAERLKKRYPTMRLAVLTSKAIRSKNGKKIGVAYADEALLKAALYQSGASLFLGSLDYTLLDLASVAFKAPFDKLDKKNKVALLNRKGEAVWISKQH